MSLATHEFEALQSPRAELEPVRDETLELLRAPTPDQQRILTPEALAFVAELVERFTPDLLADKDIRRIDQLFPALVVFTMLAPAAIGGLATWSWQGALTAFFWAGLVRVALLHHITWSINSVCHVYGERPFEVRQGDKASNFWPLAILSFGESWHNLHHADPTCARHGVLRGQIDISARVIWLLEKTGAVSNVRWPKPERIAAKLVKPAG